MGHRDISATNLAARRTDRAVMQIQHNAMQEARYSPAHIRATWSGTGSVEEAAKAFGFSRAKGYDLVRQGSFTCRVLHIGRSTRVVTASLLRVLDSGEPGYNWVCEAGCSHS